MEGTDVSTDQVSTYIQASGTLPIVLLFSPPSHRFFAGLRAPRSFVPLLAVAVVSVALEACGSAQHTHVTAGSSSTEPSSPATASSSSPSAGYWKHDGDLDDNEPPSRHEELDDYPLLNSYGPPATPPETRPIAALVKRYYAAAAAGDSTAVCSMLRSSFAEELGQGDAKGAASCAAAIRPLLAQQHDQLTADQVSTMVLIGARLKGDLGIAVLGFQHAPESTILVEREAGAWKIGELLGNELP
jgi:hypothetical protein